MTRESGQNSETVDPRRAAQVIGVLLLLLMVGGFLVNFVLEGPLFGQPGFLANAAPHSRQIALGAVLGLVIEAFWVGIAVAAFPVLAPRSRGVAIWLVVLSGVVLAGAVLESVGVMSMVSVSRAYANASPAGRETFEAMRSMVSSGRNGAHFIARVLDGVTIFVFSAALFRFRLVPRVLAGFGLVAALAMISSVGRPLFGSEVVFPLLAPLGLAQVALAVWLLAKGFSG